MTEAAEYILGTDETELDRLAFQHSVWRHLSEAALDRAGVGPGMTVLDLGCGPGFVTEDIAARVGPEGQVVALDEAPRWHRVLEKRDFAAPVELIEAKLEDAEPGDGRFDVVFSRWVFSFLPDLEGACARALSWLKPGGVLVVQDYNHEGISVFPRSAGFDAVVRATREYYRRSGGNSWVMGDLPAAARRAGLIIEGIHPNALAGGPDSGVFRWADLFFPKFSDVYVEEGLMTAKERAQYLTEWAALKSNPDGLFYSPLIVDLLARRPARG